MLTDLNKERKDKLTYLIIATDDVDDMIAKLNKGDIKTSEDCLMKINLNSKLGRTILKQAKIILKKTQKSTTPKKAGHNYR